MQLPRLKACPPASEVRHISGTFLPVGEQTAGGTLATEATQSGTIRLTCPYYSTYPLQKCKAAIKSLVGKEVEASYYHLKLAHKGTSYLPILLSVKAVGAEAGPLNKEDALLPYHGARDRLILLLSIVLVLTGLAYLASQISKSKSKD